MIHQIGKLTIAGAIIVAMTSPSLAAWVVVQKTDECEVVEESAATGEIRLAGPYATKEEAEKVMGEKAECQGG